MVNGTVERTERTAKDENLRTARPGRNLATRERERKATVAFTRVRWLVGATPAAGRRAGGEREGRREGSVRPRTVTSVVPF